MITFCVWYSHRSIANNVFQLYQTIFASTPSIELVHVPINPIVGPMTPSPFDRKLGIKLGVLAGQYFLNRLGKTNPARPVIISRAYQMVSL